MTIAKYVSAQPLQAPTFADQIDTRTEYWCLKWRRCFGIQHSVNTPSPTPSWKRDTTRLDLHRCHFKNTQYLAATTAVRYPKSDEDFGHIRTSASDRTSSTGPSASLCCLPVTTFDGSRVSRGYPVCGRPERATSTRRQLPIGTHCWISWHPCRESHTTGQRHAVRTSSGK